MRLRVKATALSRIVYGDGHWEFARRHVLLGKTYLELQGKKGQSFRLRRGGALGVELSGEKGWSFR